VIGFMAARVSNLVYILLTLTVKITKLTLKVNPLVSLLLLLLLLFFFFFFRARYYKSNI
jgi:hypothetical protein